MIQLNLTENIRKCWLSMDASFQGVKCGEVRANDMKCIIIVSKL